MPRYDQRPFDETAIHTSELQATPQRDRTVPARAWVEAPDDLLHLGDDLDHAEAGYLRRIHGWLLWRAGPPAGGDARYLAIAADDLGVQHSFRLFPDGSGDGLGPSGRRHDRFRSWKEDLRDHARRSD